ncbi:uncharacterized protein LOC127723861 [Mytilus californianus]|uniref:uncharacterized protein LOC127723861 n=1 Tax=Mytilus californianus TaxID=6549 RepID=UPI0022463BB5|nr:uncharacterized protein LOC127723861 [Mytilus californianus]
MYVQKIHSPPVAAEKKVRFQPKDDLVLLRKVLARYPFKNKSAWNEIALSVADTRSNFQVDARRVRERSHLLIDPHKKTNAESLKSSGIDEEYEEKETLLDEILSFRNSSGNIVGYLKEINEAEMVYRRQELEVKKQQLQLEEEKIQLEKQEKFKNWETINKKKTLMLEL